MSATHTSWLLAVALLSGCASQVVDSGADDALKPASATNEQTDEVLGDWVSLSRANGGANGVLTPATSTPAYVFPQAIYDNGPLMRTPRVVPIFFEGDAAAATIVADLHALAAHSYWEEAASEYGIGALTVDAPITLPAPGASVTTRNIGTLVTSALAARGRSLGDGTLYALYYPEGTVVHRSSDGAVGCNDFAAFHSQFSVSKSGATKNYGYAVMPRCGTGFSRDEMMVSSTHELFEWATDPFPASNVAGNASYRRLDDAHFAFHLFAGGGELTDFCPGLASTSELYTPKGLDFTVARHLSNRESAAGRFPCGPGAAQPYLVAIPTASTTDTFRHGRTLTTPVVEIASGASDASTQVFIHSDTAMPASQCWTLDVLPNGVVAETGTSTNAANVYSYADTTKAVGVDFTVDKACVHAGDAVTLKLHKTKSVSRDTRVLVRMRTSSGSMWNSWPFLVTVRK